MSETKIRTTISLFLYLQDKLSTFKLRRYAFSAKPPNVFPFFSSYTSDTIVLSVAFGYCTKTGADENQVYKRQKKGCQSDSQWSAKFAIFLIQRR